MPARIHAARCTTYDHNGMIAIRPNFGVQLTSLQVNRVKRYYSVLIATIGNGRDEPQPSPREGT